MKPRTATLATLCALTVGLLALVPLASADNPGFTPPTAYATNIVTGADAAADDVALAAAAAANVTLGNATGAATVVAGGQLPFDEVNNITSGAVFPTAGTVATTAIGFVTNVVLDNATQAALEKIDEANQTYNAANATFQAGLANGVTLAKGILAQLCKSTVLPAGTCEEGSLVNETVDAVDLAVAGISALVANINPVFLVGQVLAAAGEILGSP